MTLADFDKRLRRIESLLEQLTNQQPVDTTLDAEHMARLILEGKGKDFTGEAITMTVGAESRICSMEAWISRSIVRMMVWPGGILGYSVARRGSAGTRTVSGIPARILSYFSSMPR